MVRTRIFIKRPKPLADINAVVINDFKAEFAIDVMQEIDGKAPAKLIARHTFTPESLQPVPPVVDELGEVIWDSNIHGKWNDGKERIVDDKEGDTKPDGKGIFMAASGDPKLWISGKGDGELRCGAGHGRFYICAVNYNSLLELEFNLKTPTVDNLSLKMRCRHQSGGAASNRPGGPGTSISLDEVGSKTEDYHNVHSNSKSATLKRRLKNDTWYKARFEVKDTEDGKGYDYTTWIDYNDGKGWIEALRHKNPKPPAPLLVKESFDKESWVWIRMNNEKPAVIALKNVKVVKLS